MRRWTAMTRRPWTAATDDRGKAWAGTIGPFRGEPKRGGVMWPQSPAAAPFLPIRDGRRPYRRAPSRSRTSLHRRARFARDECRGTADGLLDEHRVRVLGER